MSSIAGQAQMNLHDHLELPNGARLKNRIAKSAMSERLGEVESLAPSAHLPRLYERWARGGAGLLITGNVMVDRTALGEFGNVAVTDERHLDALRAWANAGKVEGTQVWMQLNHPGRQSPSLLSKTPVAPSAVPLSLPGFNTPRALEGSEIEAIIAAFARTASVARQAGFSGVQIHGAHGYLVSQFLSPLSNQRSDEWGGTPEKRRRFLLEVVSAIREAVGPHFPVGVKLNSADFQRGGFTEEESMAVVEALEAAGIDLLEISGGTYERSAMVTGTLDKAGASTKAREAFFLDYAEKVRARTKLPLLLTGGFRSTTAMQAALDSGAIDLVGMARPLITEPELPNELLSGAKTEALHIDLSTGIKKLDGGIGLAWFSWQLRRLGEGRAPLPRASRTRAVLGYAAQQAREYVKARLGPKGALARPAKRAS